MALAHGKREGSPSTWRSLQDSWSFDPSRPCMGTVPSDLEEASSSSRCRAAGSPSARRADTQPINILFTFLQKHTKVVIWLYDNTEIRLEGYIIVR